MPRTRTPGRRQPRHGRARRRSGTSRTRAIEATLADLAHEIRTPLTGILALADLLATSELGERERGWAAAVKSTAEHLAMLTSLIVDAARAEAKGLALRREVVRPRRLAEALAASLAARAEAKGLEDESDIAADLPEAVIGDGLRLRAALENLVDNAVKFTTRGSVRLEVRCEKAGRGKLRLVFAVTDSGIGLEAAEIRRLFRPFSQANEQIARRYGGAGLGLAFVRRIAAAMGGDLTVASAPGGGSRFCFSALVEKVTAEGGADAAQPGTPLRILCAEDNPYGRVVLNTILTELGHRADFVGSAVATVEAAAQGRYDAVLLDVALPDADGLETTRRIRSLPGPAGRVAIIGVAGRTDGSDEGAARAAGMNGYLVKPLSPATLAQALTALPGHEG
jgi:CheY-like chemotaxis protein